MATETVTRTYSAQISDETFQTIKELEKSTGIPREHLFTAMVTILADKDSKIVNEVVTKAHNIQLEALQAKMKNGGFFNQSPDTSIGKSDNKVDSTQQPKAIPAKTSNS